MSPPLPPLFSPILPFFTTSTPPNHAIFADTIPPAPLQRGGAGNIKSPHVKATNPSGKPGDADVVPETAIRPGAGYEKYHTGRGGEGNVHREGGGKVEGLKEKILHPLGGGKKE